MLTTINILWQVFFATVADGIATLIILWLLVWLMLLPCVSVVDVITTNWCIVLADVIAKWQMEKPLQGGCVMADVIASGRWKNHRSITSI